MGEHAVLNHGMSYRAARASGGSRATTFDRDRWRGHVATHDGSGMVPVRSAVMSSRVVRGGCGVCSRETLSVGLTACGGRSAVRVHPNTEKRGREGSGAPCDLPCRCVFLK